MSVYEKKEEEKTWIQRQNNIEHQIVEVVLLTRYGFKIEISKSFWVVLYVKSILFVGLRYNLKIQRSSNIGNCVDSSMTRRYSKMPSG